MHIVKDDAFISRISKVLFCQIIGTIDFYGAYTVCLTIALKMDMFAYAMYFLNE